jgi:polysaccharide export outer membrane protein
VKASHLLVVVLALSAKVAVAQTRPVSAPPATPTNASAPPGAAAPVANAVIPPADYVIGTADVLSVIIWREKDLTSDVIVRPDGMVSLPLLNDVHAAGLTPEEFRQQLTTAAARYVETPNVTVMVKTINSRKVFITGEIARPGPYSLGGPTTVLQFIAEAGGLLEYANKKNISIMRTENGKVTMLRFNYADVAKGRRMEQNILLKPGDTVIVP